MSRGPTGEYSIGDQQFNLPVESRKSEGNKGGKKEREKRKRRRKGKEKMKGWGRGLKKKREREKRKNRGAKMNRCMWKRFIYIQA